MTDGVATEEQFRALLRQCVHCSHDIEDVPGRRGAAATWRCEHCNRNGVYLTALRRDGGVVTARVELVAGNPSKRRPWVQAERVPYAERVGR